ncbi:hypothetical protein GCM10009654_41350 [Streptomyces hebeiensis]|uniref:Uncharacterized protein n=1 Tax=Streptomyces hebeiensis TaxID=229486 RepID=A0ABP4FHJ3_9ACTN
MAWDTPAVLATSLLVGLAGRSVIAPYSVVSVELVRRGVMVDPRTAHMVRMTLDVIRNTSVPGTTARPENS